MMYEILKDFKGSQTGTITEDFVAGTQRELTPYLVSCIPAGWAKAIVVENKAIVTDGVRRAKAK
jgi:hypothetical protein